MTLNFLRFNNYYNRQIKPIEADEIDNYLIERLLGVNFNPADGVSTVDNYFFSEDNIPDYCVVTDDSEQIVSRWFVVEAVRTRGGQYTTTLYRDVITDWLPEVLEAPVYIEKAQLNVNDPAIFNNEAMTFNQIKTKETAIKDKTNSAWYAFYLSKELENTPISLPQGEVTIAGTYTNQENYSYDKYTRGGTKFTTPGDPTYCLIFHNRFGDSYTFGWDAEKTPKNPSGPNTDSQGNLGEGCVYYTKRNIGYANVLGTHTYEIASSVAAAVAASTNDWTSLLYSSGDYKTENELNDLLAENGKIYQFGNVYKQVVVRDIAEAQERVEHIIYPSSPYSENYAAIAAATPELDATSYNDYYAAYEVTPMAYYVDYVDVAIEAVSFEIPKNKNHCIDAPYDIMLMPYHSVKFGTIQSSSSLTSRLVGQIINTITDGRQLFDVQVLPYIPLTDNFLGDGEVIKTKFTNGTSTTYYQEIGEAGEEQTFALYISSSNITKRLITAQIPVPTSATNFKVANECDIYRLVSPNYNGQFEFSATKNNGVAGYSLSIACKPFSPYIKLAPAFNRLYGQDFGDARGLICGGDFSLFRIDDAWNTYELNNKNYLNIFDRQIQNLEVNNHAQMTSDIANALTGTLQGATTGAMAGGMVGGPYGAIAGAAVGGFASGFGGIADVFINRRLRQEALDFTKDQFGYQLGNIKAMPYSLSKVSSLTPDNKIFPILEYYTCSEIEKQALRDKIKWNGMTVMRIGTISQFKKPSRTYIKGKLIRLEIPEDYHLVQTISQELYKGVYI